MDLPHALKPQKKAQKEKPRLISGEFVGIKKLKNCKSRLRDLTGLDRGRDLRGRVEGGTWKSSRRGRFRSIRIVRDQTEQKTPGSTAFINPYNSTERERMKKRSQDLVGR